MEEGHTRRLIRYGVTIGAALLFVGAIVVTELSNSGTVEAAPRDGGVVRYGLNYHPPFQITDTPTNTPTASPTNTPTQTSTSTSTPTVTSTNTPAPPSTGVYVDPYEPNNSFQQATDTQAGFVLQNLTLWPPGDQDYFRFVGYAGSSYEVFTKELTAGLDTQLTIYDINGNVIGQNNDYDPLSRASKVTFSTTITGFYYARVVNISPADPAGRVYKFEIKEILGTSTPTPRPTGTRIPTIDQCEENNTFDTACVIELTVVGSYDFVPVVGTGPDNDFYRIWIKQGLYYVCETLNLSSVNDTNMIFYSAPSAEAGIGGNDDIDKAAGNLGSRMSFLATYTGWLYVLVGPVPPVQYDISYLYTYDMLCTIVPFTPTPTASPTTAFVSGGGNNIPPPTIAPTFVIPTPYPTPTALPPGLFETPEPTPRPEIIIVPLPTSTPSAGDAEVVNLDITVYYDANESFTPELNEGVVGVSVAVYDNATGALLAFGYTNDAGNVRFGPIAASGAVRVSVPFLGFSQVVAGGDSTILIRIAPQETPIIIP